MSSYQCTTEHCDRVAFTIYEKRRHEDASGHKMVSLEQLEL